MRKILFFLFLLLSCNAAHAQFYPGAIAAIIHPEFTSNFLSGALDSRLTFTRSSTGWYFNSSGLLTSASSNVPRFDYNFSTLALRGLLMEQASTNLALYARDMTQINWIGVNMTSSLNQTGIDGASNSASSLTATASNATILQTVTEAATAATYSVYLKRLSGTGTVNITQNGGSTWTPVTLTSSWQRFSTEASTLNPAFGVQIVTSGDSIAADINQFEQLTFASSPIPTAGTTVTRAVEALSTTSVSWYNQSGAGAFVAAWSDEVPSTYASNRFLVSFDDGTLANRIQMFVPANQSQISYRVLTSNAGSNPANIGFTVGGPNAVGISFATGANNTITSGASTATNSSLPAITTLNLGNMFSGSSAPLNGWLRRFVYWNHALTLAQLQAATANP